MKEITTKELAQKRQSDASLSIIDVREDEEVAEGMIPGATHIPMGDVPQRLNEIDKATTHHIVCRSGGRSGRVCLFLNEQGYDVVNIAGGMLDWEEETEPKTSN
ncbi:rhodanese-like domain-containing protein [Lentibacillus saliphilus]|uniref:rhodanese-like domain-containing protein n=1 Tax=Lentibacillus saliphilus TaxID=2737028 RepID=UPI001C2F78A5|nr:rhodanese-like domain-containing protein [Lentibacillus saliphilus]